MSGPSRWLRSARFDGGLLLVGRPPKRSCDLLLAPEAAHVRADLVTARLPYEAVAGTPRAGPHNHWRLADWAFNRSGGHGVGLSVSGECAQATAEVRDARRGLHNRLDRFTTDVVGELPGEPSYAVVPLLTSAWGVGRVDTDLFLLNLLCKLLGHFPTWREQLSDERRVAHLLGDLRAHRLEPPRYRTGVTRRALEVRVALSQLGFLHRWDGRPLPGEVLPSEDEVAARVLTQLRGNPYTLAPDETQVRRLVRQCYLDIDPWPFAALVDD